MECGGHNANVCEVIATKIMTQILLQPLTSKNSHLPSSDKLFISSALRYLGVIFDKSILSNSPILSGADRAGTADLCYGTQH